MQIIIKDVLLEERTTDIFINNGRITGIGSNLPMPVNAIVIDGSHMAAFPTFANAHTHAPMTLFRGYGDDHPLHEWLNEWIWPKEKNLDPEIIYWGTRLACIEMIKSGTTAFNDMYFYLPDEARAVADSGICALLGHTLFGDAENLQDLDCSPSERIHYALAPHAIYTVSDKGLRRAADYCAAHDLPYHIHMSETPKEVEDCLKKHGCRPYEHLNRLGILHDLQHRFIGAHSLHLTENEIELLGANHCHVVHNPNSNLKLGSGHEFLYSEMVSHGINVTLGTDGCSSSNNLDLLEATKTMALLQKGWRHNPSVLPAKEAYGVATRNGFHAMGFEGGEIKLGAPADLMLIDLNNIAFVPNNNTLNNLIYAAHSDCIDTVICRGDILMQHRLVADEQLVYDEASRCAKRLLR